MNKQLLSDPDPRKFQMQLITTISVNIDKLKSFLSRKSKVE